MLTLCVKRSGRGREEKSSSASAIVADAGNQALPGSVYEPFD